VKLLRRLGFGVVAVVVLLVGYIWLGLGDEVDGSYDFDAARIPADVDAYLAEREAMVANLQPHAEKRVVWAGEAGVQTPLSIVYVHGFSASTGELRPVPRLLAEALGANLHYTRLAGHGRDGDAMGEPSGADWLADTAEAIEIGRRIGERVLVVGTSTGGALTALASIDPDMSRDVVGVVMVSPNFRIQNPAARILTLPLSRWWVPRIAGAERGFETENPDHAKYWTTRYPTVATISLAHLTKYARNADYRQATIPALFVYSDADKVVDPTETARVASEWGARVEVMQVTLTAGDDPHAHLVAGDILSPSQTAPVVARILAWAKAL